MSPAENSSACPDCGGSGWKRVERGGLQSVSRCECVSNARATRLLEVAQIPPLYQNASFENFSTQPENPVTNRILQTAVTVANSYARQYPFGTKKQGLMLIGDPGTGKTHLAVAVMKRLIARGFECVFFDYQNLLERIRSSYDQASGAAQREAYQTALDCEVLVLDDLGAHRVTDWVEDTVTSLITYRYNQNKPLITTTNLRDSEAGDAPIASGGGAELASRYYLTERIGSRARSRLFEMCRTISTRGVEDYRVRKNR
ncbi:MAG: ATP-binding protein [Bryobacterales bacterium]|nr:ATP-binding protein [Bryobacterales bacterium]